MTTPERKLVIGITGGIGSGKSAVAVALARSGGFVIDADQLGHAALCQPDLREPIVARFGREILDESGAIVRRKLGVIVFADKKELAALEAIVHPWIGSAIRERIEIAQSDPSVTFVILDAAILLEAGWSAVCDRLLFVEVPREQRLARLQRHRGWTEADLESRERAQLPLTEKAARANDVITNDGSLEEIQRRVDALVSTWGV